MVVVESGFDTGEKEKNCFLLVGLELLLHAREFNCDGVLNEIKEGERLREKYRLLGAMYAK